MSRRRWLLHVVLVGWGLYGSQIALADETESPVTQQADEDQVEQNPKPEDFVGKWVGSWDDRFYVQFTITPAEDKESLTVVYEWEESLGQDLKREVGDYKIEGHVLRMKKIDISLIADDENHGKAYGRFPTPRTAKLTRAIENEE